MELRWQDRLAQIAHRHLRSAPGILAPRPHGPAAHLPRAGRQAGGVREADGLHPHRAACPSWKYPFSGSWGYQITGYFAPTSPFWHTRRFQVLPSTAASRAGIWRVRRLGPSAHFPKDAHGLVFFDGTCALRNMPTRARASSTTGARWSSIYEAATRCAPSHPPPTPLVLAEGIPHRRPAALDAVASMLYLDYSAPSPASGSPTRYGGNENLEAIDFLRRFNELAAYRSGRHDRGRGIHRVSGRLQPVYLSGLGFTHEVEHGLDARHAGPTSKRSHLPQVPSQQHHLQPALRLPGELRAAHLARRGGPRQKLAA